MLKRNKFSLDDVLNDKPEYLEVMAMIKEKWSKGGGDIKIYLLKSLICLIKSHCRQHRALDKKIDLVLEKLGVFE